MDSKMVEFNQRARSDEQKSQREEAILEATEKLLRRSGFNSMTMQTVASEVGLAKGTLYLYFSSREALVLSVYGRLFDAWVDNFAVLKPELRGFAQLCDDFARCYSSDALFLQLAGLATSLLEPQLQHDDFISFKRLTSRRVKRLAGIVCSRMNISPRSAQHLVWRLLTIAGGSAQLAAQPRHDVEMLPDDVRTFVAIAEFRSLFLNAAKQTT
jgi:AcrR family transcriptional regulator